MAIACLCHDKMKTPGRAFAPFVLHVQNADGLEEHVLAKAVIDASAPTPLRILWALTDCLPSANERRLTGFVRSAGSFYSIYAWSTGRAGSLVFGRLFDRVGIGVLVPLLVSAPLT